MTTLPEPSAGTGDAMIGSRYQIKSHVATGGTSDVYLAYDTQLRRDVIIKRLKEGYLGEESLQKIWSEAAKLASLRHANIVAIFDVVELDQSPSIIMEHLSGESIEQRAERKPFGAEEIVDIARQSLEGLIAAHHSGLIHRDLKPSNIMLVPQPSGNFQVKLLDFGMAKFVEPDAPSPQTVSIDGSITGSIYCISPEQLNHEPVDARSDLYSLGCTFYFALTGKYPFTGERVTDVITAHLAHRVTPLEQACPQLNPFVARWVMSLFQRNPRDRYSSAMDALRALEQGLAGTLSGATGRLSLPPTKADSSRKWIAVALGIAALLGIGAWMLTSKPAPAIVAAPTPSPTPLATPAPAPQPPVVVAALPAPSATPEASPTPAVAATPAPVPIPEISFRVSGSNTIGSVVGPALFKAFLESKGATDAKIQKTGNPVEKMISGTPSGSEKPIAAFVAAHGSGTAFKDLLAGSNDIGMSSRPVKPDEATSLAALGDMTSVNCEHVIGLDGLAIVTNRSNPVSTLSVAQVADIFTGKITDWSEVGGTPGPITRYGRNDVSGTFDSFQSMVLGKEKLSADTKRFEDSAELSDEVSLDAQGIGFIGLPYVRRSKALAISVADSPPLLPSPFTVATEDYALARRLYVYTPANPTNPLTTEFVEFALSPAGQEVVRSSGFISQNLEQQTPTPPADAPPAYLRTTAGARRLNTTLQFVSGSAAPDGKALRDINRIVDLLARPENAGRQLLLLGFSDASGSPATNSELSSSRAKVVAQEFSLRGLQPAIVEGFGSALPIQSNETDQGRAKNRRVEVWLK